MQSWKYFLFVKEGFVFEKITIVTRDFIYDCVGAAVIIHVFGKFGDDFADYSFLFVEWLDEGEGGGGERGGEMCVEKGWVHKYE